MTQENKDKAELFPLAPDFEDAKFPDQRFFCRHSALVEGVLASFASVLDTVDVRQIAFPRPRTQVVEFVGEANQALRC